MIDSLVWVADCKSIPLLAAQQPCQFNLSVIGILEFVNQQKMALRPFIPQQLVVGGQFPERFRNQ